MNHSIRSTRDGLRLRQRGFTLIEGLLAMVVMALGMLALVNLQSNLSIASDAAKHRTEATRLAQQKLDELRSFEQVAAEGGKVSYLGTVVSSAAPETIDPGDHSNTSFSRSWTVTANSEMQKSVNVLVAWTDRRGPQQLTLNTVIGRADPASISTLGVGPGTTVVRRPKNRNIDIPYPAVSLKGNKSAFQPPGSSVVIYFDNDSGNVVGQCEGALPAADSEMVLAGSCNKGTGYLLSGYVRFCTSSGCSTSNQPGDAQAKYANASDTTYALDATAPLVLDSSVASPVFNCYSARQVTLKSDGSTVTDTGQAANEVAARFISYACVIYPTDDDSDSNTPPRWWGRVAVQSSAAWVIGTGSGQYKVCRFTGDYNLDSKVSNSEHPLWYRAVTGTLDNQNFLVVPRTDACPTDKPTDAETGDFVSANTATHQTNGTSAEGAERSFTCSAINCVGTAKTQIELETPPVPDAFSMF